MMTRFTKTLIAAIFLTLFLAVAFVSCGKKASTEAEGTEQSVDSTEHPSDSTEHPTDSAGHEHPHEHPTDSTAQ